MSICCLISLWTLFVVLESLQEDLRRLKSSVNSQSLKGLSTVVSLTRNHVFLPFSYKNNESSESMGFCQQLFSYIVYNVVLTISLFCRMIYHVCINLHLIFPFILCRDQLSWSCNLFTNVVKQRFTWILNPDRVATDTERDHPYHIIMQFIY